MLSIYEYIYKIKDKIINIRWIVSKKKANRKLKKMDKGDLPRLFLIPCNEIQERYIKVGAGAETADRFTIPTHLTLTPERAIFRSMI
jgi:hypothetical protein